MYAEMFFSLLNDRSTQPAINFRVTGEPETHRYSGENKNDKKGEDTSFHY
jgi:hypothetical protein